MEDVRISQKQYEAQPVVCSEHLAILDYKSRLLRKKLGDHVTEHRFPLDDASWVTVRFGTDDSTTLTKVAHDVDTVVYTIEPAERLAYDVQDADGRTYASWQKAASEMLTGEETMIIQGPLYLLVHCIAQL